MNKPIVRSIAAIVVGLVAAIVIVVITEMLTLSLHPFPEGADTSDQTVVNSHVANFPHWVLLIAAVGWLLTAFVGAWIATRLGHNRHPAHGYLVGTLLFLAAALNMILLWSPYQDWFKAVNFIGIPLVVFLGVTFARKPTPTV